ncbi:hypothetical protein E2C01_043373 [Portunus trituberculatus]|uniref:Uncharacterized protein n=1 Tax=Portunus trituberculatus TaxID=210409 RepID=A0A5B7FVJ6_PORTR|nr:hypothetical protein [Portunus trituberculatus]
MVGRGGAAPGTGGVVGHSPDRPMRRREAHPDCTCLSSRPVLPPQVSTPRVPPRLHDAAPRSGVPHFQPVGSPSVANQGLTGGVAQA